jgi:hypothetical protein
MPILGILASAQIGSRLSSYESIQTVTVGGGGSATVSFTSIPSTYKHLQIRFTANNASNQNIFLRFNGDTTANYARHFLYGDGSSAASGNATSDVNLSIGYTSTSANIFGSGIVDVLDYTSTSKNKTIRSLAGYDANGSGLSVLYSGVWFKTPEAITSMSIFAGAGNINQYSSFALYGIKGA